MLLYVHLTIKSPYFFFSFPSENVIVTRLEGSSHPFFDPFFQAFHQSPPNSFICKAVSPVVQA